MSKVSTILATLFLGKQSCIITPNASLRMTPESDLIVYTCYHHVGNIFKDT